MSTVSKYVGTVKSLLNINNAVVLVAMLIATTWVWNTVIAIQRNFQLQQQVDAAAEQNAVLELENKTQDFENKYYASSEYLELSAREHLNKAGPGEKLLILPPNTVHQTGDDQTISSDETPITERSNFAQWMYFLFGKKG